MGLEIESSPPGIELSAGLESGPAPFTLTAIEGTHNLVSAPPKATVGGIPYHWTGWSDGGERIHTVLADSSRPLVAEYAVDQHRLTVAERGNGSGTVTSEPAGIECGQTCADEYDHGTEVLLTAVPGEGSELATWSGCDQVTTGDECEVEVAEARLVTASFNLEKHPLTVSVGGNGSGTVGSAPAGIECGATCSASFDHGTEVLLTATPEASSKPVAWSGCDQVTAEGECEVQLDEGRLVEATFTLERHELAVTESGSGSGTVTSEPAGIECGQTCAAEFDHGTQVLLSAVAGQGSEAAVWTGCDQVTAGNRCAVEIDETRQVGAAFFLEKHESRPSILAVIPTATITGHPGRRTAKRVARFSFSSSESGGTFLCGLGRSREACRSPKTFRGLKPGRHIFTVVPVSREGTAGPPARFRWTVAAGPSRG